ncbi:hypothetical protein DPMN_183976 [Dreissena polymorpha]|uniref:Uncharacterized protein n=1 Tax=Dreissena polymorpha TaxID=45954 RepID=A0A9D4DID0_DREPO|nr:hypothetical protein DPMN_183976 [Dreissena polymorpha]
MVELVPNSENTVTKEPVSAGAQLPNVVYVKAGEKKGPASGQTTRYICCYCASLAGENG